MPEPAYPRYIDELNARQREAVLHGRKPLLILAGAGTGKTRVITTKIAFALDVLNADPHSILAVTFTNKAAAEMRERLASLTVLAGEVLIKTFHSFGAWVLRRFGSLIGINPQFLIYDDDDMLALLKTELKGASTLNEIKQYLALIMRAKDLCLSPEDSLDEVTHQPLFKKIYVQYEKRLRTSGNLDFGDLIMKTVLLLRNDEQARSRIQERFRMILVDEYQDSNVAQFELLKELFAEETYLCVVGDDDQSIYGFRGAEVENILSFPDSFPDTEIIRLEENYRSTKTILAAASSVVAHNEARLGKTLLTNNEEGEPITLAGLPSHNDEAAYVARLIEDEPGSETAVLYRMNFQSRLFEEIFARRKIPYLLVGSLRFYEREEVKDVLSYLALLANPCDEVAARRILNKPSRGIGEKSAEKIFSGLEDHGGNIYETLRKEGPLLARRACDAVANFLKLMEGMRKNIGSLPLAQFIHEVVFETGLYDFYKEADIAEGTAKTKNLEELVNAAVSYGMGEEAMREFLENTMLKIPEYGEEARQRVTLITLHNTKGLEFERVIITGLEEGLFPILDEEEGGKGIEEERRLFYVGLTRAKRKLILTSCERRFLFGAPIQSRPSRFLEEIPGEHLVREGLSGVNTDASSAFPRGSRVYSDDYGNGYVIKTEIKEEQEVLTVQFDSGRVLRIIPKYHDLVRIHEE